MICHKVKSPNSLSLQECRQQLLSLYCQRKKANYYYCSTDWLRGFIEAEGTFTQNTKTNKPLFQVTQLACEAPLLRAIGRKIGAGRIHYDVRDDGRRAVVYSLSSKKHMITHLLPLLEGGFCFSRAQLRYHVWLQKHFPQERMIVSLPTFNPEAYNSQWLHGFTEGDGSFYFVLRKQRDYRCNYQVQAVFDLCQRVSLGEMRNAADHILGEGVGTVSQVGGNAHLRVVSRSLCCRLILPLFQECYLQSRKRIDFMLWRWGLGAMARGKHLEKGGPSLFRRIMALQRYYRAN